MKSPILLTALIACLGGTAGAQDALLKPLFDRQDSDKNGVVERGEFPGSDEQFAAMDRNRDKRVTYDEYKVSAVARRFVAARNRDAGAPRQRLDAAVPTATTLRHLDRFDRNGDGRIPKDEWTGAPGQFDALDLDRDGVLDARDRKLAERAAERAKMGTYDEFEFNVPLPDSEFLLRRYDKDEDRLISRREAKGAKFAPMFDIADANGDSMLDLDELQAMVREVAARAPQNGMSYREQERAFIVPFSTWDKNKDGRLESGEWLYRKNLFPRMDADRDGAVTKEEVARYKSVVEGDDFVEKFDVNRDGKVTAAEFAGPRDAFRRADRNGDGTVSRADR